MSVTMAPDLEVGMVFETELGERVEIVSEQGNQLELAFPDRDPQLDENGDRLDEHIQYRSRESLAEVIRYEDWELVDRFDEGVTEDTMPGSFDGPVPCPQCGQYMRTFYDGDGMPVALCTRDTCHGELGASKLIGEGYFEQ